MTPDAEFLVAIFQANRVKHGKVWRKIRRDRVCKLLTHLDEHDLIEAVISECIVHDKLEACRVQEMTEHDSGQYPALKLVHFVYKPSHEVVWPSIKKKSF
jgi:hypothetical protein